MQEHSIGFDLDNTTSDSDRVTLTDLPLPRAFVIYPKSISPYQISLITMPPRGGNAKKESGRAKKAENEAKKKESAVADKVCATHILGRSYK